MEKIKNLNKKIKKNYKHNNARFNFEYIDAKLLMGWECQHLSSKQKKYFEKIKSQTQLAMENKKFPIWVNHCIMEYRPSIVIIDRIYATRSGF